MRQVNLLVTALVLMVILAVGCGGTGETARSAAGPTPQRPSVFQKGKPLVREYDISFYMKVMGLITYTGSVDLYNPQIKLLVKNESGEVIATEETVSLPYHIRPKGLIPYMAQISPIPIEWSYIDVEISLGEPDPVKYTRLELDQPSLVPPTTGDEPLKIVGNVKNTGNDTAVLVIILAALYDDMGNLVDVGGNWPVDPRIAPGGQSAFQITFQDAKGGARYELYVNGTSQEQLDKQLLEFRQTMVPSP
jgi:hypothetical protein